MEPEPMRRFLPVLVPALVFLVGFLVCCLEFPTFASTRVVADLVTDNAYLGIVAVGMTFVIIAGGIDLSVGSVIGFTTVFLALALQRYGWSPAYAFVVVLGLAALFGAATGAVIHYLQLPPFIVTLAGMFLVRGLAFLLSTESIAIDSPLYADLPNHALLLPGGGRLSVIAMLMLAVFLVGGVLLHFTRFGLCVYALGGNRTSMALMGGPVARTTILVYTLSSTLAGLAGIVFSFYTSAGYSLSAYGVELDAIAAVVIGGTLLSGGSGFIVGALIGVLIQGLIQTYIDFDGTLSSWWAKIAVGLLLFCFVGFQQLVLLLVARAPKSAAVTRTS
jgi:ribose/xylose/arabinose/galactoside ABC-type transport system permease subunit